LIAAISGWMASEHIKKGLPFLAWMVLVTLIVFLGSFLFAPRIFDKTSIHILTALPTYTFFLAAGIRRPAAPKVYAFWVCFLLGWLAAFAEASFNFLSIEDFGIFGYMLIYGASGYYFRRISLNFVRQLVFFSPIILVNGLELYFRTASFAWFSQIGLPIMAGMALWLGNVAGNKGWWPKLPFATMSLVVGVFAIFFLPQIYEQKSWMNVSEVAKLPQFELVGLKGDAIDNNSIAGKVTWMEFYTPTCRPCMVEMKSVERVVKGFEGNDNVNFVTVLSAHYNLYEDFLKAKKVHEFRLWHGFDRDTLLGSRYAPSGVPVGLLIDKHGVVRFKKVGFQKYDAPAFEAGLKNKIDALLVEN
ncbi:MAG TPA: TlpA family protein disulfide reductase, partial [Bacteroidetes bacterium]|nr:TlpA family protein disulfide reductase [Bacteroidota bacterium]